ncbi:MULTISPECIES: iron-containing alcohol dehydrogenase [Sporomusa]|uniref:Alcohol dehydrogenase 2 n=2 Tax=Sporomusa TaxID=2375 RepID=A0ABP2C5T5_9FIRM|nr:MULTISPECIES: iron-containing alcohol dehydrogenase [Sporomusa]OLS58729.1 alcohol dehydrogenase 2 [Sporomusa sphaeroides DSM 2875]CVK19761.1 Alcohol dehydrogenase 2 [Sporomusa sphaeroides DSM 2875]SCM79761.1 Fe-containing alcohol dehydrogenase [uncultured Sporomusa sp.]
MTKKSYGYFMPPVSLMGVGCLEDIADYIKPMGFKKALIVSDKVLVQIQLTKKLTDVLDKIGVAYVIFDGAQPNPTVTNVNDGLKLLQDNKCDFVISFGGGSPHDCAKGIAIVAANGGKIEDYEGLNKSAKPQMPLIAVNTTSGTASQMTRFCIITDESRHVKMAIVDWHTTAVIAVDDAELMVAMPPALTAATGMDALTHAVEAYVSTIATPVTDCAALKAIELISGYLRRAVANGNDMEAREMMTYAEYLAGIAFNNASLGYVHAMAHQLGGFYDLPHGVCNAILLPAVEDYNAKVVPERFVDIAKAMGKDVTGLSSADAAAAALTAIRELSADIGIPAGLKDLKGFKESDIPTLAANALKDVCGLSNPKQATQEEIEAIYRAAI